VRVPAEAGALPDVFAELDPRTGRAPFVEAVPVGAARSFTTAPDRWTTA
jgi:hypothetical protein